MTWWRFHMWDNGPVRPRNSPRYRVKLWADSRATLNPRSPEAMGTANPLDVWAFQRSLLRAQERGAIGGAEAEVAREFAKVILNAERQTDWPPHHLGFLSRREPGEGLVYDYDQICMVIWAPDDDALNVSYRPQVHLAIGGEITSAGIVLNGKEGQNAPRWHGYYDPKWKRLLRGKSSA